MCILYIGKRYHFRMVWVIGKRLLLFCRLSNYVYMDGVFLCSQISACVPLIVLFI
jgi:hypothetical protein